LDLGQLALERVIVSGRRVPFGNVGLGKGWEADAESGYRNKSSFHPDQPPEPGPSPTSTTGVGPLGRFLTTTGFCATGA